MQLHVTHSLVSRILVIKLATKDYNDHRRRATKRRCKFPKGGGVTAAQNFNFAP